MIVPNKRIRPQLPFLVGMPGMRNANRIAFLAGLGTRKMIRAVLSALHHCVFWEVVLMSLLLFACWLQPSPFPELGPVYEARIPCDGEMMSTSKGWRRGIIGRWKMEPERPGEARGGFLSPSPGAARSLLSLAQQLLGAAVEKGHSNRWRDGMRCAGRQLLRLGKFDHCD